MEYLVARSRSNCRTTLVEHREMDIQPACTYRMPVESSCRCHEGRGDISFSFLVEVAEQGEEDQRRPSS